MYDVAVVGAGPAGATAALHLARGGMRVALIEKEAMPRYKTCGGGVVGRAFLHLPGDIGIPVEHECFAAQASFLESGLTFRVERDVPIVSMTMRGDLDKALADAAVRSGAELLSPCALLDLHQDADGVDLTTSRGAIRARWVVGADGVLSTVARKAGFEDPPATIPALEVELRVPPHVHARFAGVARFDFEAMEAGYGWVFPKREHLSCGILTMERGRSGLQPALERYLARVGVGEVLSQERHGYVIPVRPRRGGFVRGRVMLAGDAAGLADALTGEGISISIRSGRIAAQALIEAGLGTGTERSLRRALRRSGLLAELRIARAIGWIVYRRPRLARELFRRRGDALCHAVTDVYLGKRTFASLLVDPAEYVRLARSPRRRTGAAIPRQAR